MASYYNGEANGSSPNIECLKQLLPANNGLDADASHREVLERLRQVQGSCHCPCAAKDVSGVFTCIWKKDSVPEYQITETLNVDTFRDDIVLNGMYSLKPKFKALAPTILLRSDELTVTLNSRHAFLAVLKVTTGGDGAILAERLIPLSAERATVRINGIGLASSFLIKIEPYVGCTYDLLVASILARSMAAGKQVTSTDEQQKVYDGKLKVLSTEIAAADREMNVKLAGLQNASTDLDRKTDRMQLAIDLARDNYRDFNLEATNVKLTVRNCELALEAERGRLEDLVAENRRLTDAALQAHAELQDRRIAELSTAMGRMKMLTCFINAAFMAILAILFIY